MAREHGYTSPVWLRSTATAHALLGEYDEAIELLERAMREGGPKADIMRDIAMVRDERRKRARAEADPGR